MRALVIPSLVCLAACGGSSESLALGGYVLGDDETCEGVEGLSARALRALEEGAEVFETSIAFRDLEGAVVERTPLRIALEWPASPRVVCYPAHTTAQGLPVGPRVALEVDVTYETTESDALDEVMSAYVVMVAREGGFFERFVVAERAQAELRGTFRHDPAYLNVRSLVFVTILDEAGALSSGNLGGNLFDVAEALRSGVLSGRAGFATWPAP